MAIVLRPHMWRTDVISPCVYIPWATYTRRGINGFIRPTIGLNTDAEYVANLVNVSQSINQLEAKDVSPSCIHKPHAGRRKAREMPFFVPGDLDLWHLTLTFKVVWARHKTRFPCEFGANPFSGSRDISYTTRMWASAQRYGRPALAPSIQGRKVWLTPITRVPCSNAAKTRNSLKFGGVPQTRQQISAVSRPKFTILRGHVEEVSMFNNFFPIVDTCLSCEDTVRQSCVMVPKWRFFASCIFSEPRAAPFRHAF